MTTITVLGAGGVINNEITIIADALRSVGYIVEIDNPYPNKDADVEHVKAHMTKFNSGGFNTDKHKCEPSRVRIVAHHIPWGG